MTEVPPKKTKFRFKKILRRLKLLKIKFGIDVCSEFTSKCRNPRNKEELIISYESALKLGGLGIGFQIFGNPTLLQRIKQKAESLPNQFLQKKVKSPNSNKNKNQ